MLQIEIIGLFNDKPFFPVSSAELFYMSEQTCIICNGEGKLALSACCGTSIDVENKCNCCGGSSQQMTCEECYGNGTVNRREEAKLEKADRDRDQEVDK